MKNKGELRAEARSLRRALTPGESRQWAAELCKRIATTSWFQEAHTVMAYLAMAGEADVDGLIVTALSQGKEVLVPHCLSKTEMEARRLTSLNAVDSGAYGIRVPSGEAIVRPPSDIDLVLVPGLAFDESGARLGMGAGYYDRFLERCHRARWIGVAWDCQVLSPGEIPMDVYDKRLHGLITNKRTVTC